MTVSDDLSHPLFRVRSLALEVYQLRECLRGIQTEAKRLRKSGADAEELRYGLKTIQGMAKTARKSDSSKV